MEVTSITSLCLSYLLFDAHQILSFLVCRGASCGPIDQTCVIILFAFGFLQD